jgi:hypothetical protein
LRGRLRERCGRELRQVPELETRNTIAMGAARYAFVTCVFLALQPIPIYCLFGREATT